MASQSSRVRPSLARLSPGARIAVAVGSRGIADIVPVARDVVARLKQAGLQPFIVPAMGSMATPQPRARLKYCTSFRISRDAVGAPILATMETVELGEVDGIPLLVDKMAWGADGVVLVNRVKPHTDFSGPLESGLVKMLVIGLGKQRGAEHYHRLGVVRGLQETIPTAGHSLLMRDKVLFGIAVTVENERHQTAIVRVIPANEIEAEEGELLAVARQHLPDLPLDDIDLLIVDAMGKDISGSGMDTNVIGTDKCVVDDQARSATHHAHLRPQSNA